MDSSIFNKLLNPNGGGTIIYLTDALLFGFSLYYVSRLLYSNYVEISIEKPYQFIFKLLIFSFIINFSYFIFDQLLNINFLISSSIQEIGKSALNCDITFSNLISKLNSRISLNNNSFDLFSFDGILKSITSAGLLNLLLAYSVRYILIQFFIISFPLIFLTLLNSSTSWIFKSWIRCFLSLLFLQIFVPFILIIIFSIDDSNKIIFLASIYALTKTNSYIREIFGGINVDFSNNISGLLSHFKK